MRLLWSLRLGLILGLWLVRCLLRRAANQLYRVRKNIDTDALCAVLRCVCPYSESAHHYNLTTFCDVWLETGRVVLDIIPGSGLLVALAF